MNFDNIAAGALALLLHGVVIGAFFVDWEINEVAEVTSVEPYYIQASLAAENPHTAKKRKEEAKRRARIQARNEEAARIEAINTRQRLEQERLAALAEEKARLEEANKKAPPKVAEVSTPEPTEETDQEELREESESELQLAIRREAEGRRAVTDDEKAMAYVAQIQAEIIQNWSRPPSARNGMQALLKVYLVPTGEVVDVSLLEGSGNDAFDRSALIAVRKAERFLVPDDPRQFERNFREFEVLFRPEDLRL